MSPTVAWEQVASFPNNDKTQVLEKTLRQVKLSEDKKEFLVLSGRPVQLSAEEKKKREKQKVEAKQQKKSERAKERAKASKGKEDKLQKYKDECHSLVSKIRKLNREIKELGKERNFTKAEEKQDQLNELRKELARLKNLPKQEVYERY